MVSLMGLPVEKCRQAAADVCAAAGVDLEEFSISKAGRREVVRVVVDCDGGVDLDSIAEVSLRISDAFDAIDMGEESPFVLEVGSPGVDRPLTESRHWRRALGHLVDFEVDGVEESRQARITAFDADMVELTSADGSVQVIPISQVRRAVVQVEFNRGD